MIKLTYFSQCPISMHPGNVRKPKVHLYSSCKVYIWRWTSCNILYVLFMLQGISEDGCCATFYMHCLYYKVYISRWISWNILYALFYVTSFMKHWWFHCQINGIYRKRHSFEKTKLASWVFKSSICQALIP